MISKRYNKYLLESTYVGQISYTFLIFTSKYGMTLVDQHAAHERILYEYFMSSYRYARENNSYIHLKKNNKIILNQTYFSIIRKNISIIDEIGFNISVEEKNTIHLRSYLSCYKNYSLEQFIKLFVKEFNNVTDYSIIRYNFIKAYSQQKACRSSWKSGFVITRKYASQIQYNLNKISNNSHCPHGRPIMHFIHIKDLLKYFCRRNCSAPFDI